MSVTEPSDAVKCRNGKQTGGRRLALRPPVNTLACLGLALLDGPFRAHLQASYVLCISNFKFVVGWRGFIVFYMAEGTDN